MSFRITTGVVCLAAGLAHAAAYGGTALTYDDLEAFQATLQPGAAVEAFDTLGFGDLGRPNASFTPGTYSLSATAASGNLQGGFDAVASHYLSTSLPSVLTVHFLGGGVSAAGAFIFGATIEDQFAAGLFAISLSDGTNYTHSSASIESTPFVAFLADPGVPFEWMRITSLSEGVYTGVDNLAVGHAVIPEASTYALCTGVLALGFAVWRRRR